MASMKGASGMADLLQAGGGQITSKVWESFMDKAGQASSAVAEGAQQLSDSVTQGAKDLSGRIS